MPFGMYPDEEDQYQGLTSPTVRDYLMRKRESGLPQPVDTMEDVNKMTPPPSQLTAEQENMAPLQKSSQEQLADASDSSGVRRAETADMIAQGAGGIGKILAQALNAKYASRLKQPVDYSGFDSISQMGKGNLANARAQRQESIDGFKSQDALNQRDIQSQLAASDRETQSADRDRKISWEDESRGFQRSDRADQQTDRDRTLGMQSEEDDPNSGVSRSYQQMASKMTGGKSDYSGASATRLKAALPALSKMYEFDQSQQARRDAMNERRQMHEETLQNRMDAANQKHQEKVEERQAKLDYDKANPKPLGAEQQKRHDDSTGALKAIDGMDQALKDGDWTVKPIGTNNFLMNRDRFTEFFGRLQSGGAIGKEEGEKFKHLIPVASDTKEQQKAKLVAMKAQMELVLAPYKQRDAQQGSNPGAPPPNMFPKTVRNTKTGLRTSVDNEAELNEARAEGFDQ